MCILSEVSSIVCFYTISQVSFNFNYSFLCFFFLLHSSSLTLPVLSSHHFLDMKQNGFSSKLHEAVQILFTHEIAICQLIWCQVVNRSLYVQDCFNFNVYTKNFKFTFIFLLSGTVISFNIIFRIYYI